MKKRKVLKLSISYKKLLKLLKVVLFFFLPDKLIKICKVRSTVMKKLLVILLGLLLFISFSCTTTSVQTDENAPIYHLVVLHTNDHHGHPVAFFNYPAPNVGGLPARATFVQKVRDENENVLVLDAGDLNTGRPESNFFKAEPDIIGYNYIGYDAMALGNHEFDNPLSVLKKQMEMAKFPFLSANVKYKDGSYVAKPYIIKEFKGFKVAIFGLTTKETETIGNPSITKDLIFEDEVETAKKLVPELRKKADIVIALVHMGIYDSVRKGSKRLGSEVDGIDLIVDGHTHTKIDFPIFVKNPSGHNTLIVQAWCWGLVVGKMDLWIQNKKIVNFKFEAVPMNLKVREKVDGKSVYYFINSKGEKDPSAEIKEDPKLKEILQPYVDKVSAILDKVIGKATDDFLNKKVRYEETALGDMVADSMAWYAKTQLNTDVDFALQNGGGIRTDLPAGDIKMGKIYEILPFDNSVMIMQLKGSDVQKLFDYIATIPRGKGAFPQVSKEVSFTINYATGKCENILINGQPIDPEKIYKIATNSYLAAGGDGYKVFLKAVDSYDASIMQRDVFIQYIQSLGGTITPKVEGRIKIIEKNEAYVLFKMAA